MSAIILILFALVWTFVAFSICVYRTKSWRIPNPRIALLYISFMAMLGPVGEIFVGTLYETVIGQPLWQYRLMPTHDAYTSLYAPVIWGIAGAYLYVSHEVYAFYTLRGTKIRAILQMTETITVEALLNLSFLVLTGGYLFYYLPGDLFHITSLQTLPFYYVLALVVEQSILRFRHNARYISVMSIALMFVAVFLRN